jgi:hypothetical protein
MGNTLFLQTRLLEDTVQRARCQIVAWFAWNGNSPELYAVLELAVTTPGRYQIPPVLAQHPQYV